MILLSKILRKDTYIKSSLHIKMFVLVPSRQVNMIFIIEMNIFCSNVS